MKNIIRTIYLYIFALLGLVLIIIGGVRFVDMGLKVFVFKQAEEEEKIMYYGYNQVPYPIERMAKEKETETVDFSEEEKIIIKEWINNNQNTKKVDLIVARRHKNASSSLSMILIGLPLYLYHWSLIVKDNKNKK